MNFLIDLLPINIKELKLKRFKTSPFFSSNIACLDTIFYFKRAKNKTQRKSKILSCETSLFLAEMQNSIQKKSRAKKASE